MPNAASPVGSHVRPDWAHAETLGPVAAVANPKPWTKFEGVDIGAGGMADRHDYEARDPFPIPATKDREGYHGERHYDYWLSGLKDYLLITQRLRALGVPANPAGGPPRGWRVLDFGCASGRVLRHFACQGDGLEVIGCDIAPAHVRWVETNLAPTASAEGKAAPSSSLRVFHNSAVPPLPVEPGALDLVYAFSVFSHIDEQEVPWLEEIRRVLKPGGYAYLTTHTEHTWGILSEEHAIYRNLLSRPFAASPAMTIEPAMFRRPLPAERVVFSLPGAQAYGRNVFQSTAYIEREWGRLFEVCAIHRQGAYYQDAVIVRKCGG